MCSPSSNVIGLLWQLSYSSQSCALDVKINYVMHEIETTEHILLDK